MTQSYLRNCYIAARDGSEVLFTTEPSYHLDGYVIVPGEQYADLLEARGTPADLANAKGIRAMVARAFGFEQTLLPSEFILKCTHDE